MIEDEKSGKRQRQARIQIRPSLLDLAPVSLGRVLRPLRGDDDLLEEMLDGGRD
jgi:hypothetical protein